MFKFFKKRRLAKIQRQRIEEHIHFIASVLFGPMKLVVKTDSIIDYLGQVEPVGMIEARFLDRASTICMLLVPVAKQFGIMEDKEPYQVKEATYDPQTYVLTVIKGYQEEQISKEQGLSFKQMFEPMQFVEFVDAWRKLPDMNIVPKNEAALLTRLRAYCMHYEGVYPTAHQ